MSTWKHSISVSTISIFILTCFSTQVLFDCWMLDLFPLRCQLRIFDRSFARPGSPPLVCDFIHLEPPPSVRDSACLGLTLLTVGITCVGFVFSPLIVDMANLGLAVLAKSFTHFDLPSSTPDFAHIDPTLFLRSFSQPEPIVPVFGVSCVGLVSSLPLMDRTTLELSLLLQSFA